MATPSDNPYAPPQTPSFNPPPHWPPPEAVETAPCFRCGCTYAKKVEFTWWGGLIGPRMFHHVKCLQCGQTFNSRTGRSNVVAIILYQVVLLIVIAILYFALRFV
jgi:hypothetical protein